VTSFLWLVCVLLLSSVVSSSQQCPTEDLNVFSPFTSRNGCVSRWKPESATLVIERDCQPCQKMLKDLSGRKKKFLKKLIEIVIIEESSEECLKEAIKVQLTNRPLSVWCSKRQALKEVWRLSSTPVLFWQEGESRQMQVGLFQP